MDKATVRKSFQTTWDEWTSALAEIDPALTREPGVADDWTIHDVAGHVQGYVRYWLLQLRAAFELVAPSPEDSNGDRQWPEGVDDGTLHKRNEAIRLSVQPMSWQQLLDEAAWLRERTLDFIDARTEDELNEDAGWVHYFDPSVERPDDLDIHIRRVNDAPNAEGPMAVWRFTDPDGSDGHMHEHLDQIRSWLAKRT